MLLTQIPIFLFSEYFYIFRDQINTHLPRKRKFGEDFTDDATTTKGEKEKLKTQSKSVRKSRAKKQWFKCNSCNGRSSSNAKFCDDLSCRGTVSKVTDMLTYGVYTLPGNVFSVRRNHRGRAVRCFVNTITKECSSCDQEVNCRHVKAVSDEDLMIPRRLETNKDKLCSIDKQDLESCGSEIFILNGETVMVVKDQTTKYGYVHCTHEKCDQCSRSNSINSGPKKQGPDCPHKLAIHCTIPKSIEDCKDKEMILSQPKIAKDCENVDIQQARDIPVNHKISSAILIEKIIKVFQSHLNEEGIVKCLKKEVPEDFQEYLDMQFDAIMICANCCRCNIKPYNYNKVTKGCYFITSNSIQKVKYRVKFCEDCGVLTYPDLTEYSLINTHLHTIFTFNVYMSILTLIKHSNSVIEILMEDIENLAKGCDVEVNSCRNIAQSLYRSVLAVGAGVISETDLNDVVCPTCGKYPSTVCSDGNVKNATKMPSNILFDKKEEIPDLLPFRDQLVSEIFLQNSIRNVEMSKKSGFCLPSIIAPVVQKRKINTEREKHKNSFYQKQIAYNIHKTADAFLHGEISIAELTASGKDAMDEKKLKEIFSRCCSGQKLGVAAMKQALINALQSILAGNIK